MHGEDKETNSHVTRAEKEKKEEEEATWIGHLIDHSMYSKRAGSCTPKFELSA